VPRAPLPDTSVTGVRVASSTTSKGITPSSSLLRAHAPNQPPPPDFVVLTFFPEVLAGCCEPPAGNRFFPTLSPQIFPQMPGPQPRRSHRVHLPVSSSASSAFLRPLSSRLPVSSANTIFRGEVSRLSSDISYVQASEFACLPDRSHRCRLSQGGRDFYFQAERASLPPHALDMLSVRYRQLTEKGLSPFQICGLVGHSKGFPSFRSRERSGGVISTSPLPPNESSEQLGMTHAPA